ncbi:hypothetical protein [Stenotrophomonas sp. NLF4-10]|uniref:hypothetical protein n=1 Tax=Stenotrophomonas sp. NLF4-10 TaxID=2918754 RepID=UPI001EFAB314|nr:hypothetical protein [Stenotrophomonas sp. NLF4-10]MCG8277691.1 hypothetical protein [Stenotrophomonas sp. NLF4-10]
MTSIGSWVTVLCDALPIYASAAPRHHACAMARRVAGNRGLQFFFSMLNACEMLLWAIGDERGSTLVSRLFQLPGAGVAKKFRARGRES